MKNPFQYGGVVGEDAFCDRQTELADLLRAMQNSERLFLFSERRMGKTSLVRLALARLPRDEHLAAYVDLWPTDSEKSFVTATARALTEATATRPERMLDAAKALFPQLSPVLTLDEAGKPELRFEAMPRRPLAQALEDVLSASARIAEKRKKRVVVVFDEFPGPGVGSCSLIQMTRPDPGIGNCRPTSPHSSAVGSGFVSCMGGNPLRASGRGLVFT